MLPSLESRESTEASAETMANGLLHKSGTRCPVDLHNCDTIDARTPNLARISQL
jgi:hypothetical protein